MLKWITGSKVDHPLADPKGARELVAELPPHDFQKALDEISGWLEGLAEAEGLKLDRQLEVLELLDTAARPHHRKLVQEYLGMTRQQKFQETKLWTAGQRYAKALTDTYLACVKQYRDGANGASAVKKQIPVVIARTLRASAMRVKWTMLRYGPFEAGLWSGIGEIYDYSVAHGFEATELTIYPGALHGTGTIRAEFAKVLMLWSSSTDVLPPVKQEIADRTIAHFAKDFRVEPAMFAGALYAFDAAQDRPPVRLVGDAPPGETRVYLGPGEAPARLKELQTALESTGSVPSGVSLGASYPPDTVLPVWKHLALYWSDKPPARTSERRETTARITVVPGYFALLDELERDESDALNFSVSSAESWIVENVSDRGYGALVPASTTDWIRVGEIIGLQVEGAQQWGVGIIRRVMRDEQRQFRVGIEVISRGVTMVRISHVRGGESEYAVLLSGTPDQNGEVGLVMRAGRYDPNVSIELTGRSKSYRFLPSRMMDAGDDFDWATFKVAQPV